MGYNIIIGNAEPHFEVDGNDLIAEWGVKVVRNDEAPAFPGDEASHYVNSRFPSYSAWADAMEKAGLKSLFMDEHEGLFRRHPGCVKIDKSHFEQVCAAEERIKAKASCPPGFGDGFNPTLARVVWLRWWMGWAIANCEVPAIQNS